MDFIPYGRQFIDRDDVDAVAEVLRDPWLTQGPRVTRFEDALAERCGARFAVACNSGTAALHLALLAARVGPNDKVVVPAMTFLATANCAVHAGADVRFADVDFATVLATERTLAPHLRDDVRAVMPVHFAGKACDMESIGWAVRSRCPEAVIIEDACHALGGRHADGTPIGSLAWSDMAVFSFHPVKHIAGGEGGAVLTDDPGLAERLRQMRNHGTVRDPGGLTRSDEGPWYYEMHEVGYNFRIPDINCALALSQLGKLDRFLERRREIAACYRESLAGLPGVELPFGGDANESAWHIYCLHVDFDAIGKSRKRVVAELHDRGIGTQVHYYPVPMQPYYRRTLGHAPGDFPGAERHYARALTIPLYPAMTDRDVRRVVDAVKSVTQQQSRTVRAKAA